KSSSPSSSSFYCAVDTINGFTCENAAQESGICKDYIVRFQCPDSFCIDTGSTCWTPWFNRDDPSGTGDWETLEELREENPGLICDRPLDIDVQTASGDVLSSTGDVITLVDTSTGFICKNSDQTCGKCEDYRVRFQCPDKFCSTSPKCWTPWFDRDNPSGTGDWETLKDLYCENPGKICSSPLQIDVQTTFGGSVDSTGDVIAVADTASGFICKNSDQKCGKCKDYRVRFECSGNFCTERVCWTNWFDRDDSSGTGDWELLEDLQTDYPKKICETPLFIDVMTTDTNTRFCATGQISYVFSPTLGFVCRNDDQIGDRCHDYKVRFGCACDCNGTIL
uniref:Mucin-5AC-like n=1 Tax=Cynoglossus semilaevis TaxID=244447 RepID=A0A3P8X480_CYNSE